jgi:hypothetical protein
LKPYSNIANIDGYIICQYAKTPGVGLDYKVFVGKTETQRSFQFDDVSQYPVQFAVIAYTGTPPVPANLQVRLYLQMFLTVPYTVFIVPAIYLAIRFVFVVIHLNWSKYLGWGNEVSGYKVFNAISGQQIATVRLQIQPILFPM